MRTPSEDTCLTSVVLIFVHHPKQINRIGLATKTSPIRTQSTSAKKPKIQIITLKNKI